MISQKIMRQIEGRNPVREALRAGTKITRIIFSSTAGSGIEKIVALARKKNIPVEKTDDIKKHAKSRQAQGIIAMAEEEVVKLKDLISQGIDDKPLFVVVSGVEYEHNLGSILRSAECFGAKAVIAPRKSFGLSPVVAKASAGASEHIPLILMDLHQALKDLRKAGCFIFSLEEKSKTPIVKAKLDNALALVIGAEDKGIMMSIEKFIDQKISIPLKGKVESLNMASACSIALYECMRQRSV